jgi:membrane-associated phospholipid phosphatase
VRRPLTIALSCVVLGVVLHTLVTRVPAVGHADVTTLYGFMGLWPFSWVSESHRVVGLFDPAPYAALIVGIVVAAALMGRLRIGLLAVGAMLCASATSEILKHVLATPHETTPWLGTHTWPSGHTTGAMSFALALVLIAPPRWRWLAATVGGVLTVATAYGILINAWHFPSDVLGGLLVSTFWASLAVLPLRSREPVSWRAPALAGVLLAGAGAVAVLSRPEAAATYATDNTTFVVGALAIAFAVLALSGSVLAPTAAPRRPQLGSRHARG